MSLSQVTKRAMMSLSRVTKKVETPYNMKFYSSGKKCSWWIQDLEPLEFVYKMNLLGCRSSDPPGFRIDEIHGSSGRESLIKARATSRFNDLAGFKDLVAVEPLLLLPRRFRKN
uniref:Uncharacterized protein n=1 Tax=Solanum lycopersicum TaxID=4081 RepID=A0A3Q7HKD0_SOLLC